MIQQSFSLAFTKRVEDLCPDKTCTWMFIAASCIIAKTWNQSRCPSVGKWINKLWYTQTMKYCSALKRNELSSHEKTWGKLKCILLRDRSQSEKVIYCRIPTLWHSGRPLPFHLHPLPDCNCLGHMEPKTAGQALPNSWPITTVGKKKMILVVLSHKDLWWFVKQQ